ncbi:MULTISPECIES: tail fiber assembly protein [Photorhabdus]|uniref:Tail assembly protein n=2 Tax=Photorhabdus TaxID=29487 RepID=A0A0F7LS57_9GAMM|nr:MULTISPECIES: tail fiber assembly protein [Photorhabdus]AKH64721.1 tail assembly protein [Photorhabdus thracensis]EQB99537.1 putative tail fiber protein [Photorhabdus temperata subsp. temperata M1021]KER02473.1 Caudovirales tail fiber assembly protein [Photorhabdus temperata subsp. temperata Meg1]
MTEQKYSLEPEVAVLGKDGLAEKAGWINVYHTNQSTREFTSADIEYLMLGIGLSAGAYPDALELPSSHDLAVWRSENGKCWETVPDYRGKIAYNKQTRIQQEITKIGELPETLTFKQPKTHFDIWNGKTWVINKDALKANQIEQAEQQRATLRKHANETVMLLQHAVDAKLASEAEKTALLNWKKYFVLLSRVDTSLIPDIEWPEKPE